MLCIRGMLWASAEVLRWNWTCWGQRLHVAQSNLTMTSSAWDSCSLALFLLQPDVCGLPSTIMFIWKTDYLQIHGISTPQWFSLQHSVLDRLEPRGSKDREFDSGRSEPKGGGIWWYRFTKRSHLWRVFRTGVLGRCRYAWGLLSQPDWQPCTCLKYDDCISYFRLIRYKAFRVRISGRDRTEGDPSHPQLPIQHGLLQEPLLLHWLEEVAMFDICWNKTCPRLDYLIELCAASQGWSHRSEQRK